MKEINVNELKKLERPYVIDVRTLEEQAEGMIEGSISMPMDEVEGRISELPVNRPIYVLCRSGRRSEEVAKDLIEKGYDAVNLVGGINEYEE